MVKEPFSKKQLEFICKATKKWNIAHGSVRSGKTVCTLFAFMHAVDQCPNSDIYMVGYSADTIYRNAIRLILESPQFSIFRPFCIWSPGKRELKYKDKTIKTLGAWNEGSIGQFQGNTWTLGYCDEMTLYPDSIIDMIDTRLSTEHSKGFASMNPSHPDHKIKKWIDMAEEGDPNYFSLHFTLDDNPYVPEEYKQRISQSLSGVFYKRNFLGLWCLAEGAIFDFFDKSVHVVDVPPRAAEYWVAGIDYGTANNFSCVLMGVNTGYSTQLGPMKWFEKEYVWDSHERGRQKTNFEYAEDVERFLEPYAIKHVYVDPSAASFKLELRKLGYSVIDAVNDVSDGINFITSEMKKGSLFVCKECKTLIKEIQGYCWDPAAAKKGYDKPLKKNDHSIDAARYAAVTHKVAPYQPYKHNPFAYQQNRFMQ